jgi:hypothetical protein
MKLDRNTTTLETMNVRPIPDKNWEAVREQARHSMQEPTHRQQVIDRIRTACEKDRTDPYLAKRMWTQYFNGILDLKDSS